MALMRGTILDLPFEIHDQNYLVLMVDTFLQILNLMQPLTIYLYVLVKASEVTMIGVRNVMMRSSDLMVISYLLQETCLLLLW